MYGVTLGGSGMEGLNFKKVALMFAQRVAVPIASNSLDTHC